MKPYSPDQPLERTLGDICAEWLVFFIPVLATWFGWQWLF